MRIKPANPDAVIRHPHNHKPLKVGGEDVPESMFWHRRLLAEEVVRVAPDDAPAVAAPIAPLTTR